MPSTTDRIGASKPDPGDPLNSGSTVIAAGLDAIDAAVLIPRGAWDSATQYSPNDVVTQAGSSYYSLTTHTNHQPPNATHWAVLASGAAPVADRSIVFSLVFGS